MKVRTRFAPSPTGFLHIGGVRTALFAYAYAKKNNGKFILRIEDTDKDREVEGAVKHIQESLLWLGVVWDEGPEKGGKYGPYVQSERLEIYRKWANKLIKSGFAYTDPFTKEEVDGFREKAKTDKKAFLFRNHRPEMTATADDWYGKLPLRFKTPIKEKVEWHDEVWGDLAAGQESLDDFILIKADGYPTYNFAHLIDDHLMQVSHVMRGEEFLPSVPKYLALHEALEIEPPKFVTFPHILKKGGGKKLSKRDGAQDALEYREAGYLPEAVFNFIASLGWNDGTEREIFTPDEIVERFDISRLQKSGAQFDKEKLDWVNWQHVKALADANKDTLFTYLSAYFSYEGRVSDHALELSLSKANQVEELINQLEIFAKSSDFNVAAFDLAVIDKELTAETASEYIREASSTLQAISKFESVNIEKALRDKMAELEASPRAFLNLVRWAISGKQVSPNLFEMIEALSKEEAIQRLNNSLN